MPLLRRFWLAKRAPQECSGGHASGNASLSAEFAYPATQTTHGNYSMEPEIKGSERWSSLKIEMSVGEPFSPGYATVAGFGYLQSSGYSELAIQEWDVLTNFLQRTPK